MPSLYIVLYQFGSEANAKTFVTNNSGIDATPAIVTMAQGIAEGSWVVTFPENLNQLPSGFSPVLTYNGNTQTYESFAPFIDLSTINIITIPDGTPIIYRGVPVTNLANGPTASVTGHWVPGVWDVQYIYPPPPPPLPLQFLVQPSITGGSPSNMFTVSTGLVTGVGRYIIPQLGENNFLVLLSGSTQQESDVGVLMLGNPSSGLTNRSTWGTESGESWGTAVLNFSGWNATDNTTSKVYVPQMITATGDYHDFFFIITVGYQPQM